MENKGNCLTDFQRKLLLKRINSELRSEYRRRIEIMLLADRGRSQSHIYAALRCSQETARYWINSVIQEKSCYVRVQVCHSSL